MLLFLVYLVTVVAGIFVLDKLYELTALPLIRSLHNLELWVIDALPDPWYVYIWLVDLKGLYFKFKPISCIIRVIKAPNDLRVALRKTTRCGREIWFAVHFNVEPEPTLEAQQAVTRQLVEIAFKIKAHQRERDRLFNILCETSSSQERMAQIRQLRVRELKLKYAIETFAEYQDAAKGCIWVAVLPTWQDYTRRELWPNKLLDLNRPNQ